MTSRGIFGRSYREKKTKLNTFVLNKFKNFLVYTFQQYYFFAVKKYLFPNEIKEAIKKKLIVKNIVILKLITTSNSN